MAKKVKFNPATKWDTNIPDNNTDTVSDKETQLETGIIEFITKFYDKYSDVLEPHKKKIMGWYNRYYGIRKKKSYQGLANIVVNEPFSNIETLVSNMWSMIMLDDPFFVAEPTRLENETEKHIAEALLRQQLHEIGFNKKFIQAIRKSSIEGIVFIRQPWRYETKVTKRKERINALTPDGIKISSTKITESEVPTFDCFDFQICNTNNIIVNPFKALEDSNEILEIRTVSWNDLLAMQKDGIVYDIQRLKINQILDKESDNDENKLTKQKQKDFGFNVDESKKNESGEYTIYDYWGKTKRSNLKDYDTSLDADELVDANIIVCNNIVIGARENPYWDKRIPYFAIPWVLLDDFLFGISAIQPIEGLSDELNDTRNQILDHKTFALFNIWIKQRNSGIKNSDLKIKPNGIITTDGDVNTSIKNIAPNPQAFAEGMNTEAVIKEDIRRITGATNILQGVSTSKRQTLGEIQTLQMQGGARVRLIAITIAETFLKPFLERAWLLNQQYMNTDKVVKIVGQEGIEFRNITPDNIVDGYKFIPKIMTDAMNRMSIKSSLIEMLDIISRVQQPSPVFIKLARKIYEMDGFKDGNDVLPDLPPPPPPMQLPPAPINGGMPPMTPPPNTGGIPQ